MTPLPLSFATDTVTVRFPTWSRVEAAPAVCAVSSVSGVRAVGEAVIGAAISIVATSLLLVAIYALIRRARHPGFC